jgi:uncharacterized protein (DUF697 family)/tellurite resistance protein
MNQDHSDVSHADSLLAICLFASFSDGEKCERERAQVARMAEEMGVADVNQMSRQILMGKLTLAGACAGLTTKQDQMLGYEMARAVCEAEGSISADEQAFLAELRKHLALGEADASAIDASVDAMATAPLISAPPELHAPDNGGMILKYAILNGALELLPQTLATMAIIPLQMKMVYHIGKSHGVELDRSNIKDFLATAGLGIGSQVLEGFARKMMSGLGKKYVGKMAGRIANQATGSAFSFASTYAIGQIAERYYGNGSRLQKTEVKTLFSSLTEEGKNLYARYAPEIQQRAGSLDAASVLSLVRGKAPV